MHYTLDKHSPMFLVAVNQIGTVRVCQLNVMAETTIYVLKQLKCCRAHAVHKKIFVLSQIQHSACIGLSTNNNTNFEKKL